MFFKFTNIRVLFALFQSCSFHRFQLYSIISFQFNLFEIWIMDFDLVITVCLCETVAQIELCEKYIWKKDFGHGSNLLNANMELSIFLCTYRHYISDDSSFNRLLLKMALLMLSNGIDKFRCRIQVFCIVEPIRLYRI